MQPPSLRSPCGYAIGPILGPHLADAQVRQTLRTAEGQWAP